MSLRFKTIAAPPNSMANVLQKALSFSNEIELHLVVGKYAPSLGNNSKRELEI